MHSFKALLALSCIPVALAGINDSTEWDKRFYMFPGPHLVGGGGGAPAPIAVYPEGGFLIGGMFTNLAGVPVLNLARWNGTNWVKPLEGQPQAHETAGDIQIGFTSSIDAANGIYSIAAYRSSSSDPVQLLIGGAALTNAGGQTIRNVAWWTGSTWHDLSQGTTGLVTSVLFDSTGRKYAAGNFSAIGGVQVANVASFNGTEWEPLGNGLTFAPDSLVAHQGNLIAGGWSGAGHALMRWTGAAWEPVGDAFPMGSGARVLSLLSAQEGLYVAGSFTNIGSVTATNVALWNGTVWQALGSGLPGAVSSMALYNGELMAAGRFHVSERRRLAAWNGAEWRLGEGGPTLDGKIIAVDGNKIFTRGQIDNGLDAPPRGAAYFDGTSWRPIGQGLYESLLFVNGGFTHLLSDHRDLIFAGIFPINTLAQIRRWDDLTWQPAAGPVPVPRTINAVRSQGDLLWIAASGWSLPNNARIAATDGKDWFYLPSSIPVNDIAVAGAKVFAGGNTGLFEWKDGKFESMNSFTNAVVSLATDGNTLFVASTPISGGATFSITAFANGVRTEIASSIANAPSRFRIKYLDGALYALGNFTTFQGKPIAALARWDGSEWGPVLTNFQGWVYSLATDGRDSLFIGGRGPSGTNLFHVKGTAVTGLKMPSSFSTIEAAHWWKGSLYIAGPFSSVVGVRSEAIAAWHDPDAVVELSVKAPTNAVDGATVSVDLNVFNVRSSNLSNIRLSVPFAPGATPINLLPGATVEGTNLSLQLPILPSGGTNVSFDFRLNGVVGTNFTFQAVASSDTIPTFRSHPTWTTITQPIAPPAYSLRIVGSNPDGSWRLEWSGDSTADWLIERSDDLVAWEQQPIERREGQPPSEFTIAPSLGIRAFWRIRVESTNP